MKIIYDSGLGGVSVMTPVNMSQFGFKDEGKWLDFVVSKDVPVGKSFEIVQDIVIPKDRTFRNAWKKTGKTVEVDMPKARTIHMYRIRRVRDAELDKSDKEMSIELERGPASKALKDKRQALRDIPQNFDLEVATTPDELKALWPTDLPIE